ncbi:nitrate- and nitrite sensing domain-containing protein [Streptomyces sp. NPDC051561]|uniref:sensor histidine kinase n=1 Tax=Streptomyces sp. NPDC051561 TaxID=3365658 RepID=UPI0037AA79F8
MAAVGVIVLAAGAPSLVTSSDELTRSQRLLDLAELNRQALALAHSLADERDDTTARTAAVRTSGSSDSGTGGDSGTGDSGTGGGDSSTSRDKGTALGDRTARVDRQIAEFIDPADAPAAAPAALRDALAKIPAVRRAALGEDAAAGTGAAAITPLDTHKAYTEVIDQLRALTRELARKTPPRAGGSGAAPATLGNAVEQATASRGLLVAALSVPRSTGTTKVDPITGLRVRVEGTSSTRTRDALSAAAQQARFREVAALADFDLAAPVKDRDSFAATVSGPEVKTAERYLGALTDQPTLSTSERRLDAERIGSTLTPRIDRMRGAEAALASAQTESLAALRDDDVSGLELRIALLAACFLLAVGISTAVARTLTQPLAVLRLGAARLAADPQNEEPVRYTGRNDEFAQAVRSLNSLHAKVLALGARTEELAGESDHLAGQRHTRDAEHRSLAAERDQLAAECAELVARAQDATVRLEELRATVQSSFVKLSLRTLGVVERQLSVIESLEEREQDPDRLAVLFKLDHMATVMRRHGENLLVLAGSDHGVGHPGAVPLVDVTRAAISEIERYERITLQALPPHSQVAGYAADDLSHLLAELLENATSFSPPDTHVQLSGWLLESGEIMLSVQDGGIGMAPDRLTDLNSRLADPATYTPHGHGDDPGQGLGLQVASLLAARHGVRIQLREQTQGGITAVVVLPKALLPDEPPAVPAHLESLHQLPGQIAENNSNVLPGRALDQDPLIAVAEKAVEEAAAAEGAAGAADEAAADEHVRTPDDVTPVRQEPVRQEPVREEPVRQAPAPEEREIDQPTQEFRLPKQTPAQVPEPTTVQAPTAAPAPAPEEPAAPVVTGKGLPKRTPKVVKPASDATPQRTTGVDADALRRRLGGFHQGAKEGRRDVEEEIASSGNNGDHGVSGVTGEAGDLTSSGGTNTSKGTARTETEGDTVEEARS